MHVQRSRVERSDGTMLVFDVLEDRDNFVLI